MHACMRGAVLSWHARRTRPSIALRPGRCEPKPAGNRLPHGSETSQPPGPRPLGAQMPVGDQRMAVAPFSPPPPTPLATASATRLERHATSVAAWARGGQRCAKNSARCAHFRALRAEAADPGYRGGAPVRCLCVPARCASRCVNGMQKESRTAAASVGFIGSS